MPAMPTWGSFNVPLLTPWNYFLTLLNSRLWGNPFALENSLETDALVMELKIPSFNHPSKRNLSVKAVSSKILAQLLLPSH